jgi:GNAT superfamily N-acetyltransferase
MALEKYDAKQLKKQLCFEHLDKSHTALLKNFKTFQTDLAEFLVEDALSGEEWQISNTYLVFDRGDLRKARRTGTPPVILAYITILNDSIRLDGELKDLFKNKGVEYKALPALKIGRLCVHDDYRGHGLGSCLIAWAVSRVVHMNRVCACRFITLDAKRHSDQKLDSYHFYRKLGFLVLKRKGKSDAEIARQNSGTTPMYLDLYKVVISVHNP